MAEYNENEMREYVLNKFKANNDYEFLEEGEIEKIVDAMIKLDNEFMESTADDDVYDDEKGFEFIMGGLKKEFEQYKTYCMRLTDDYMDYLEEYLESVGEIEWV